MNNNARPSPQEESIDIDVLTHHLCRLQKQLADLALSLEDRTATQAKEIAQGLETITTSFQRVAISQSETKERYTAQSGSSPFSQAYHASQSPETISLFDSHCVTDSTGLIQFADETTGQLLQRPLPALIGHNLLEWLAPDDRLVLQQYLQTLEDGEPKLEWKMPLTPLGQDTCQAILTIAALRAPNDTTSSVHWRLRNLSAHKMTSREFAVFITDLDGQIKWVNDACTRLTGYEASELIGIRLKSDTFQTRHAHQHTDPGPLWRYKFIEQRKDGQSCIVEQICTPLRNNQGQITHFVAIHQDMTVRNKTEERFFHLAYHDPLTNLPNRLLFYDRLTQALAQARRHSRTVGVIFLDLDGLKAVNDRFGHDIGDALLRTVADRLKQCVRATDTVARLSGDEFTIIVQDLEHGQHAEYVAQKILKVLSQPLALDGRDIIPHASLGIAVYPLDATNVDLLIAQADQSMYRAKEKGGHCYQFVSEEMNVEGGTRFDGRIYSHDEAVE